LDGDSSVFSAREKEVEKEEEKVPEMITMVTSSGVKAAIKTFEDMWRILQQANAECRDLRERMAALEAKLGTGNKRSGRRLYTTTSIAKEFGMSAQALHKLLRARGVVSWSGGQNGAGRWVLTNKYHGLPYIKRKSFKIVRDDGRPDTAEHSYWTQAGVDFLHSFLLGIGLCPVTEDDDDEDDDIQAQVKAKVDEWFDENPGYRPAKEEELNYDEL
jgi:phage antirepressor YoqD-like protein